MTTKEKLLQLFESRKGVYLSGEEIAEALSVSRAAVWKAVESLRNDGYSIDAGTNKGYCLSPRTDILSPQGIAKYLRPEHAGLQIRVVSSVGSTNALVRGEAENGTPEGYVLLANEQTAGKGRFGRAFFSPAGTGVYLSILLRPNHCSAGDALPITAMAAAALCLALEEVSDEQPKIKWVNDIFVRGKKVCGILTEGTFSIESGAVESMVLGLGLDLYPPRDGFPEELNQIAGAVFDRPRDDMKNRLTASFLNHFFDFYRREDRKACIEAYRSRSFLTGKPITVITGNQSRPALVMGIDDSFRLQVQFENGEQASLSYGEVRIRWQE